LLAQVGGKNLTDGIKEVWSGLFLKGSGGTLKKGGLPENWLPGFQKLVGGI